MILLTSHLSHTYRTNSDSALHQSAMNPKPQEVFAGGSQELQPKRGKGILCYKDTETLLFINAQCANAGVKPQGLMSHRRRPRLLVKYL